MTLSPKGDHLRVDVSSVHEWDVTGWVPDKPSACDYGYVIKGNAIACSREELLRAVASQAE